MNKIWQSIKAWWKKNMRSDLDRIFEQENAFINKHRDAAIKNLESLGWAIISRDERVAFYGFRIQKGEHIHRVSLREALEIK